MSLFKNGTVMIVVGTVITAALILMTNRDDEKLVSHSVNSVVKQEIQEQAARNTDTQSQAEQDIAESTPKTLEPAIMGGIVAAGVTTEEKDKVIKETTTELVNEEVQVTLDTQKSLANQKAVVQNAAESEKISAAPEGLYNKKEDNSIEEPEEAPVASNEDETSKVENETNSPIWLDQTMGDFKSVETRDVEFIIMPDSSSDLQGSDPKQVITSKVGKFSPSAIPDNYNYQQMPMINGGYYIAPMPNYLMSSVLPNTDVE